MPWGDAPWTDSWLPLGDNTPSVAEQRDDPGSVLSFCRSALALRRGRADLVTGDHELLPAPPGVLAWRRGAGSAVALNLGDEPVQLDLGGEVLLSTSGREEASSLEPWQGVVLGV
jgi:alpha-glucosidase